MDVLASALEGELEAVHQARVASRRLREVLPALAVDAGGGWRRVRGDVRRVTRALGPVRELDVAAAHFAEAIAARPVTAAAQAAVRRVLQLQRVAALKAARAKLTASRVARLQTRLDALTGRSSAPDASAVAAAMTARVLRAGQRVEKAVGRVGAVYVPGRLHAVRIAVKRLRYALEAQNAVRGSRATSQVGQLRAIQDLLGRAHDLHVLDERLRDVQVRVMPRSRATARDLAALSHALDLECRALHAAFMSRRGGLLALSASLATATTAPRARAVA